MTGTIPADETGFDRALGFTIPSRDARGRVVRLGPVLETVLSAHQYPTVLRNVLAEALVLTALMGALLKEDGSQLTLQAQTEGGAVEMLVCDYRQGEVRGYLRHDPAQLDSLGPSPSLAALFGRGFLAVTFDLAETGQRYQGIVPLEGENLADACQSYFELSEQLPTLIRIAVGSGERPVAAGMLVQHLAEAEAGQGRLMERAEHPEWEHVVALAGTVKRDELLDEALSLEALVWRLFHEEDQVLVDRGPALERGCRCTVAHYESILSRFPEQDRIGMRDDAGVIPVECEFCSKAFAIRL